MTTLVFPAGSNLTILEFEVRRSFGCRPGCTRTRPRLVFPYPVYSYFLLSLRYTAKFVETLDSVEPLQIFFNSREYSQICTQCLCRCDQQMLFGEDFFLFPPSDGQRRQYKPHKNGIINEFRPKKVTCFDSSETYFKASHPSLGMILAS